MSSSKELRPVRDYDLLVLGSGPAGIHAAVQAAKLKKRVVVIERNAERIGGAWIHTGTIPSKTIREALEAIHTIKFHAGEKWVARVLNDISADRLYARAHTVASQEEALVRRYLQKNNVEIMGGFGSIEDPYSIRIVSSGAPPKLLTADNILIATGSRPRRPEEIPFDGWRIVDSDEILNLSSIPKRLVIYGAGIIGCEYACIFGALGVDVTIIDSRKCMMQTMDQEITRELQKAMEQMGIKFHLGYTLKDVRPDGPLARSSYDGMEDIESDVFFFAAGRVSNTENLGLERVGIKRNDRGAIIVNEHFQTSIPNIYAAGDAIGPPALAATSTHQGRNACLHAFGVPHAPFPKSFPIGVYTIPELSSVGRSEEELKAENRPYIIGRAYYREVARGYIRGDSVGLLKLIVCAESHKILGIHIVGADASNLVHIGLPYMQMGGHVQDMVNMVINYPTLAEAYRIASFNALNKIFPSGIFEAPPQASGQDGGGGRRYGS